MNSGDIGGTSVILYTYIVRHYSDLNEYFAAMYFVNNM